MATDVGTGLDIGFTTGGYTNVAAEILSANWSGPTAESIDTSHTGTTTARTFIRGDLYDPGELSVELNFVDPGAKAELEALFVDTAETVTVTLPEGAGATSTWACAGFFTGLEWSSGVEEKQVATLSIKFTGAITVTD